MTTGQRSNSDRSLVSSSSHDVTSSCDVDENTSLLQSHSDGEKLKKGANNVDARHAQSPKGIGARHVLAFMAFLGFMNVFCLRVVLSVALVAMVNSTDSMSNTTEDKECPAPGTGNKTAVTKTGEFDWDERTQGFVLGAFFYGYIVTQFPGGWIATRFGGKNLFGYAGLCTAVLTLVSPVAARCSVYLLITVRILLGLAQGVVLPAMHSMWGRWAPVLERSKLVSFSYAGSELGTVISHIVSGLLCDSDIAGGWPSSFYVFGSLGIVWFLAWMFLVFDSPAKHPRISAAERDYIESSLGTKGNMEPLKTPWRKLLTCPAVWAIAVAQFTSNWGFYTLLTTLPTYMSTILKFNMKQNGFYTAIPYGVSWILQTVSGVTADWLRRNGYLSTKNTRKLYNTIGMCGPGLMLILTGYVGCDHVLAMVCLTLAVGLRSGILAGYSVNHLDISPKFAGVMMGLTNGLATIPGFLGPAVVGYLTDGNQTRGQWQIIFYITSGMTFTGALVFNLLAQGEEMQWSKDSQKVESEWSQTSSVTNIQT